MQRLQAGVVLRKEVPEIDWQRHKREGTLWRAELCEALRPPSTQVYASAHPNREEEDARAGVQHVKASLIHLRIEVTFS